MSDEKEFVEGNDAQREEVAFLALDAAINILLKAEVLAELDIARGVTWDKLQETLDEAEDAIKSIYHNYLKAHGLNYVYIDEKHIVATAMYSVLNDQHDDVHPYCRGSKGYMLFGQWTVCREARMNVDMADEEGKELELGDKEPEPKQDEEPKH